MALVLALLIVAIITAMVVEFAYGVYVQTSALHNWQAAQEMSLTAKSAVRLASKMLPDRAEDSYTKGFTEITQESPLPDLKGSITLRIEDEYAKFNLNSLGAPSNVFDQEKSPYNSFGRLLASIGLKDEIADRIWDWIDADSVPNNGRFPETETGSKNAKLDSVDELPSIPGIDRETYEKLLPYVTIFNSDNKPNINSADVPVLMSASKIVTRDLAEQIMRERRNASFRDMRDLNDRVSGVSSLDGYISFTGAAFRVVSTAQSGDIKRVVECVIDTNEVKYWKEM